MSAGGRWSCSVGPHGHTVRVEERRRGGNVYLVSWCASKERHEKTSLGYPVRDADGELLPDAVERAEAAAAEASNDLIRGAASPHDRATTVGEACDLFRREVIEPDLRGKHAAELRRDVELLERVLGRGFELARLGPKEWRAIRRDRASGAIDSHGRRVGDPDDRRERSERTVQKTLKAVRQLCRFAARWRRPDGSFLIDRDPTRGLDLPTPRDQRRPGCPDDLLADLLDAAPDVEMRVPTADGKRRRVRSYLREMIVVAAETGCRRGALCALRWSDWDADGATHGAIRFRADADKTGRTRVVPVTRACRDALAAQRRRHPGVGDAPVWPGPVSGDPLDPDVASAWLREAEAAVRDHVRGWGWHALRRRWANRMKDRSPVDVAALGGWAGPHVMQTVYQTADLEGMERALLGDDREAAGGGGS